MLAPFPSSSEKQEEETDLQCQKPIITPDEFVKSLSVSLKAAPTEKIKLTLKSRVGYTEKEVSIVHAKLAEMEINKEWKQARKKTRKRWMN